MLDKLQSSKIFSENKISIYVYINLQVSISAPAIFPVGPKWILINFPCNNVRRIQQNIMERMCYSCINLFNLWKIPII